MHIRKLGIYLCCICKKALKGELQTFKSSDDVESVVLVNKSNKITGIQRELGCGNLGVICHQCLNKALKKKAV